MILTGNPVSGFGYLGAFRTAAQSVMVRPAAGGAMAIASPDDCGAPPGFTWDATQKKFVLLKDGQTPVGGPCGWSPINFPGDGMQIGPFLFPWTEKTMPGGYGHDLCVGEHGDYNTVNKDCPVWTTVIHDPLKLPAALVPHLQKILLSDVEGNGHGFGNFWYNDHWTGADGSEGQAITLNQYQMWMAALGMHEDQNYYLNFIPVADNGHGYAQNWYEGVPIAQFDNVLPGTSLKERYGIWLALEGTGGFDAPLVLRVVVDSIADARSRIPDDRPWWKKALDDLNPLNWPGMLLHAVMVVLGEAAKDVAHFAGPLITELGDAVCGLLSDPNAVTGIKVAGTVEGGPAGGAAAGAAVGVAQSKCGSSAPDCKDPKNAQLPQCVPKPVVPPIPPKGPWYTQWYVFAGAALVVGLLLTMKPKAATEAAKAGP